MNLTLNHPRDKIIRQILDSLYELQKSTLFFGVDGGQGSGKSTFLKQVKNQVEEDGIYNPISIETDNFLIDRSIRDNLPINYFADQKNIYNLWDFNRLSNILNFFMTSTNTSIVEKNLYTHASGMRNQQEIFTFGNKNLILLGGPHILYSKFPTFDYKVFLKVSKDRRFINNIKEGMERGRSFESRKESFEKFENFYEPYFSNKLGSYNMIIDNNDFIKPVIDRSGMK
jgi:uridine kinase